MLNPLLDTVPQTGRLVWIGLAAQHRGAIEAVSEVEALTSHGLVGDHHAKRRAGSKRQVTLIQAEHLPVVSSLCGRSVSPEHLRRNLVVSGINLVSLKNRAFRIGEVELEGTGEGAPCSRMEENLGPGGFQAMRGHGGITAKVLRGGALRVGDEVTSPAVPAHAS